MTLFILKNEEEKLDFSKIYNAMYEMTLLLVSFIFLYNFVVENQMYFTNAFMKEFTTFLKKICSNSGLEKVNLSDCI